MPEINFYLRPEINGKSLIYAVSKYAKKERLEFSWNAKIDPKLWDKEKRRVKGDEYRAVNDQLVFVEKAFHAAFNQGFDGIPPAKVVKERMVAAMNKNLDITPVKAGATFYEHFEYVANKCKPQRKKNLLILMGSLKKQHQKLDWDGLTTEWLEKYRKDYKGAMSSINAYLKLIQFVVAGEKIGAIKRGYIKTNPFDEFTYEENEPTDAVALTTTELFRLWKLDLSNNEKLEQTRDLFLVGCFTGLRAGNFKNILAKEIVPNGEGGFTLKVKSIKTKRLIVIDANVIIRKIFERYHDRPNRLPKASSSQDFNRDIKRIGKQAGLVEIGVNTAEPELKLYECLQSHTGRRTFCTRAHTYGMSTIDIMALSGHTDEKSLMGYIRPRETQSYKASIDMNNAFAAELAAFDNADQ